MNFFRDLISADIIHEEANSDMKIGTSCNYANNVLVISFFKALFKFIFFYVDFNLGGEGRIVEIDESMFGKRKVCEILHFIFSYTLFFFKNNILNIINN